MADLNQSCPGRDLRFLKVEETACPDCGYVVEIFSDEPSRKCPKCGTKVLRTKQPGCAEWCSAAATCALLRAGGEPPGQPPED